MEYLNPPLLSAGDKVALVAPARKVSKSEMAAALEVLTSWGLEVRCGQSLYSEHHQFGGTDDARKMDLQTAMDDPSIKAIFCARGGYGSARLVDHLSFISFWSHPKWVIGFSDITVLLHAALNLGVQSIHGIMPILFSDPEAAASLNSLKQVLFDNEVTYRWSPIACTVPNAGIDLQAPLIGGNLSLISNSIGTPTQLKTKNSILFLEDLDEYYYHIDRMMGHLDRNGCFKEIKALLIGRFSQLKDNSIPFGYDLREIVLHYCQKYSFPVFFDVPIGHGYPNYAVRMGATTHLQYQNTELTISQKS